MLQCVTIFLLLIADEFRMLNINRLIWDQWNIAHIAHHDVFAGEVEEVCHGEPKVSDTYDGRLRVVGPVLGKILTVILAPKNEGVYYVVTARTADRQERRQYKESKGGEKSS